MLASSHACELLCTRRSLPPKQRISFANYYDPVPRLRTRFTHDFEVTVTMVRFSTDDSAIVPVDRDMYNSDWRNCTAYSWTVHTWPVPHTIGMAETKTEGYRDWLRRWDM